jgi:hypothetical protein
METENWPAHYSAEDIEKIGRVRAFLDGQGYS